MKNDGKDHLKIGFSKNNSSSEDFSYSVPHLYHTIRK